jgi:hypothetical protein
MTKITRRTFILQSTVLATLFMAGEISAGSELHSLSIPPRLLEELQQLHEAWFEQVSESPASYLRRALFEYDIAGLGLDEARKQDFLLGNLISVNGLVLSKTETAFMVHFFNTLV